MKSERRHELQHNELAEWLYNAGQQLKPYQNSILAGVVALAVLVVGYTWWARHNVTRINDAWTELGRATDNLSPEMLANVAEEYPNTLVGQTAGVVLGDLRLFAACNQRFTSATIADRELKAAQEAYSKILQKNLSETLQERATFGLARGKETGGNLDDAKRLYSAVANQWPEGAYAAAAKQRLADFKEPEMKLMFTDLRKFEPKGEFSDEPGALGPPPSSSPPTFDMPKEPPVGNAPNDIGNDLLSKPEEPPPPLSLAPARNGRPTGMDSILYTLCQMCAVTLATSPTPRAAFSGRVFLSPSDKL